MFCDDRAEGCGSGWAGSSGRREKGEQELAAACPDLPVTFPPPCRLPCATWVASFTCRRGMWARTAQRRAGETGRGRQAGQPAAGSVAGGLLGIDCRSSTPLTHSSSLPTPPLPQTIHANREAVQELNTAVPVLVASGDLSYDFLSQFQARCAAVGRAYGSGALGRCLRGRRLQAALVLQRSAWASWLWLAGRCPTRQLPAALHPTMCTHTQRPATPTLLLSTGCCGH